MGKCITRKMRCFKYLCLCLCLCLCVIWSAVRFRNQRFLLIERCKLWWQLLKWADFAQEYFKNSGGVGTIKALEDLNEEFITKSVLLGNGLKPSVADVYVYATSHSSVVCIFHR